MEQEQKTANLILVVMALGVVLNAISRSAGERRIWVPVTIVLLVASIAAGLLTWRTTGSARR